MQEDIISRTDYKLLFLERNAFKDRKIFNQVCSRWIMMFWFSVLKIHHIFHSDYCEAILERWFSILLLSSQMGRILLVMSKSLIHHQRIRREADVVVLDDITLHQDNPEFPELTSNKQFCCVPCIYLSAKSVF